MLTVVFNKPVKYDGVVYQANTNFQIADEDKDVVLADGGHLIETAEPGQTGVPGLGSGNADMGVYKGLKKDEIIAELDKRQIDYKAAGAKTNPELAALLIQNDAEVAQALAEELTALKEEAVDLQVEVLEDDTLETLRAKIDAKKAAQV